MYLRILYYSLIGRFSHAKNLTDIISIRTPVIPLDITTIYYTTFIDSCPTITIIQYSRTFIIDKPTFTNHHIMYIRFKIK